MPLIGRGRFVRLLLGLLGGWACASILGCSRNDDLMPLGVGRESTYLVRSGYPAGVQPIRMARRLPVAGVMGVELEGPLGTSQIAWKDGVLLADSTVNGRFDPPLPLLCAVPRDMSWTGTLETLGRVQPATATLTHTTERLHLGSREVATVHAILTLMLPSSKGKIELETWYQSGVGMVQQEQRTNGNRVMQLQLVTAPIR